MQRADHGALCVVGATGKFEISRRCGGFPSHPELYETSLMAQLGLVSPESLVVDFKLAFVVTVGEFTGK